MDQRKLKGLIVEYGITQKELAQEIGVSREMFNRKINGKTDFSLIEAFKISDYFKKPISEIFLRQKYTVK